jgi:hypothetical protein
MVSGAASAKCPGDKNKNANVNISRRIFTFINRSSDELG